MIVSKLNFLWKPKWLDNMSGHPGICSDNARFWPDIFHWPAVISSPGFKWNLVDICFMSAPRPSFGFHRLYHFCLDNSFSNKVSSWKDQVFGNISWHWFTINALSKYVQCYTLNVYSILNKSSSYINDLDFEKREIQ